MDIEAVKFTDGLSPEDRTDLVLLKVDTEALKNLTETRSTNKVFEYFYNVCGYLPPVNNIGCHEADQAFPDHWGGVKHSHALFQGINRPYVDGDLHEEIYIYIISPKFVYKYVVSMSCVARRVSAPPDAVFAVYVRFDDEGIGTIISWEWVFSDDRDKSLPDGYDKRYSKRIW